MAVLLEVSEEEGFDYGLEHNCFLWTCVHGPVNIGFSDLSEQQATAVFEAA